MAQPWTPLLQRAVELGRQETHKGGVATYIPELGRVSPDLAGVAAVTPEGELCSTVDATVPFTLQSVSKVLTLMLALEEAGFDVVFSRVGMEATGDPFNSIVRLETLPERKPLNPFINAGAIAVADLIPGTSLEDRVERLLSYVRRLAGNPDVRVNEKVARSEWETGHRNRALAYFLKDVGVLRGDVEETLRVYFAQCAIEMTCEDLARVGARLAYPDGSIAPEIVRTTLAIMTTCGLYNGSGEFAVRVGMCAKSGVGGGILAVTPGRASVATFGPALDARGNSLAGVRMLRFLSEEAGLSTFDPFECARYGRREDGDT